MFNILNGAECLSSLGDTVRTEIIGHHARTLELPLLVRSVSQVRAGSESSRSVSPPNPEGGILDVLAPCPIISVLTVNSWRGQCRFGGNVGKRCTRRV